MHNGHRQMSQKTIILREILFPRSTKNPDQEDLGDQTWRGILQVLRMFERICSSQKI